MRREYRRPYLYVSACGCSYWRFGGCKLWRTVVKPALRFLRGRVSVISNFLPNLNRSELFWTGVGKNQRGKQGKCNHGDNAGLHQEIIPQINTNHDQ